MLFATMSPEAITAVIASISGLIGTAAGLAGKFLIDFINRRRANTLEDQDRENLTLEGINRRVLADRESWERKYDAALVRLDRVEDELAEERSERRAAELWIDYLESMAEAQGLKLPRKWADIKSKPKPLALPPIPTPAKP